MCTSAGTPLTKPDAANDVVATDVTYSNSNGVFWVQKVYVGDQCPLFGSPVQVTVLPYDPYNSANNQTCNYPTDGTCMFATRALTLNGTLVDQAVQVSCFTGITQALQSAQYSMNSVGSVVTKSSTANDCSGAFQSQQFMQDRMCINGTKTTQNSRTSALLQTFTQADCSGSSTTSAMKTVGCDGAGLQLKQYVPKWFITAYFGDSPYCTNNLFQATEGFDVRLVSSTSEIDSCNLQTFCQESNPQSFTTTYNAVSTFQQCFNTQVDSMNKFNNMTSGIKGLTAALPSYGQNLASVCDLQVTDATQLFFYGRDACYSSNSGLDSYQFVVDDSKTASYKFYQKSTDCTGAVLYSLKMTIPCNPQQQYKLISVQTTPSNSQTIISSPTTTTLPTTTKLPTATTLSTTTKLPTTTTLSTTTKLPTATTLPQGQATSLRGASLLTAILASVVLVFV